MTDNKLEQLLRADVAPARDPLFRIAVLTRLERRRFWRQIAAIVGIEAWTLPGQMTTVARGALSYVVSGFSRTL